MTELFKVMETQFFGGKICIQRHMTLENAREMAKDYGVNSDVYTSYYILPDECDENIIYDYYKRIPVYEQT